MTESQIKTAIVAALAAGIPVATENAIHYLTMMVFNNPYFLPEQLITFCDLAVSYILSPFPLGQVDSKQKPYVLLALVIGCVYVITHN